MEGGQSTENFDPRGDGDDYGGGSEVGASIYIYADREHVVGSNDEAEGPDAKYGVDYSKGAERFWFGGGVGYNM